MTRDMGYGPGDGGRGTGAGGRGTCLESLEHVGHSLVGLLRSIQDGNVEVAPGREDLRLGGAKDLDAAERPDALDDLRRLGQHELALPHLALARRDVLAKGENLVVQADQRRDRGVGGGAVACKGQPRHISLCHHFGHFLAARLIAKVKRHEVLVHDANNRR